MPVTSRPELKRRATATTSHFRNSLARVQERSRALNQVLGIDNPLQSFDLPPLQPTEPETSPANLSEPLFGNVHDPSERKHSESSESLDASRITMSAVRLEDDGLWPGAITDVVELLSLRSPVKLEEKQKSSQKYPAKGKYHLSVFRVEVPAENLSGYNSGDSTTNGDGMDLDDNETEIAAGAPTPILPYPCSLKRNRFGTQRGADGDDDHRPPRHANNVPSNNSTAQKNNPSITASHDSSPLFSTVEPLNVVPHLEKLLEQWIRFGSTHSDALHLLTPRKITINSVTAKTLPKARCRSDPMESPREIFSIQAEDVLQVSMYEFEVLPAQDGTLLNNIYHETSAVNPNIWTVLYIREQAQRIGDANMQNPGKSGHAAQDEDSNTARKRHAQDSNGETRPEGETDHHSWQIVAWPSAHVTKFFEVLVPVSNNSMGQEKADGDDCEWQEDMSDPEDPEEMEIHPTITQNKTTAVPSLIRKVAHIRQPRQCEGRTHLKDVRSYTQYKSLAQIRAGRQFPENGTMGGFRQINSQQSLRQRTDAGQTQRNPIQSQQTTAGRSDSNGMDNYTVSGEKCQRFTSLQFHRGGNTPLLSAEGVDLAYWRNFCHHFGNGDLQLDIVSPIGDGPIMVSEQEYLLRRFQPVRGLRGSDHSARGDTPILSRKANGRGRVSIDSRYSTLPFERRSTSVSPGLWFALQGQNVGARMNPPFPISRRRPLPQHSLKNSAQGLFTLDALQQEHGPLHPNQDPTQTSVESTPHFNPLGVQKDQSHKQQPTSQFTPTSAQDWMTAPQNRGPSSLRPNDDQQSPMLRGWQAEMLAALAESRQPAWHGWTERSANYQARLQPSWMPEQRVADRLFDAEKLMISDVRRARDGGNPFAGQRIQMARRRVEKDRERYLQFLEDKKKLEAAKMEERLQKQQELWLKQQMQIKAMEAAQHRRALCTLRAAGLAEEAVKMGQEFIGAVEEGDSDDKEDEERE